ncbi:MAG: ABC transporter substrate-binding protein [Deltaproteobacteria bacterium]|nr:ABC transporter substrate-binding protein [Deltaproteobacteria bacterium]MBW2017461.1 ABC transporter substrate-binding protein [Deltaproteobacteria bacterium]MBW2127985.1 ABC transporter substrate-binding protein [Deltaproteobacteria bacterium]MBW2302564.1 ABC transporter substrate-binding protein [Deltaproteobacteria bacterium]
MLIMGFFLILGLPQGNAADTVKVGIVLPLTGAQAKFGEIEKKSFDMALEEINKAGGINGKPLELIIEDDTSRPEVGRSVVEKLINKDKVVMVGGGYSSSVTYAVAGVCQQNRMPFLVNTGSADKITTSGWDYIFRLNPPVSHYADAITSLLAEKIKPKTVAILHENSLFGTKGAKSFEKICKKAGYKVLMKEGYEHGGIDFKPVLIRVKQLNPDIVYMVSYIMDASLLMKQAKELKLTPKMFIGGAAGFTLPEFAQNAGVASEKVISATLWHQVLPFPGAMDYYKKFVARYKKPTEYHGAEAYSAAYVIADVLRRAKSFKNTDIKQALAETDMMTVFGPVKFTTWGKMKNQNKASTYVVQWINGKLELVWPANLATKPFAYPIDWLKTWGY